MGPYVVIGPLKRIEDALLEVEIRRGRSRGLRFERLVHALVSTVLLWTPWSDALVSDPKLQPPDVQSSEAVDACRGKWCPVVAAYSPWETVLAKQEDELRVNAFGTNIESSMAAEEIAAEVIEDGERVAVDTIAHEELPFEVDSPD